MDGLSFTEMDQVTDEMEKNRQELLYKQHQAYRWFAAEGMVCWDLEVQNVVRRPSASKIAEKLGISRQTLYNWRKLPDAKKRIEEEKHDIVQTNIGAIWNALFLKACTGDTKAVVMYLANFDPQFQLPSRRKKSDSHDAGKGSLAEALNEARKRREQIECSGSLE